MPGQAEVGTMNEGRPVAIAPRSDVASHEQLRPVLAHEPTFSGNVHSHLQLTLELVQEAPVGALGDDLIGA